MVLYKNFKKSTCYLDSDYKDFFKERLEFRNFVNYGSNRKIPVHNWFPYKEAFSRKLVVDLLTRFNYLDDDKVVLDPFCGVGTTPLTAKQLGIQFLASDLSPLCIFITKSKLDFDKYNLNEISAEFEKLKNWNSDEIAKMASYHPSEIFEYPIFKKAFPNKNKLKALFGLKHNLEKEFKNKPLVKQFFNLALLNIVEDVSSTQKDGAFLRVVNNKNGKKVMELFLDKVQYLINSLKEDRLSLSNFTKRRVGYGEGKIQLSDSRELPFDQKSVDITITSPPYLNRYDYTRIYQLELYLLFCKTFDELRKIRYNTVRSHVEARYKQFGIFSSEILSEKLKQLSERKLNNLKIPEMIQGYFDDMYLTIKELFRVTKDGGIIAFVVGNTRFSGVSIPVDTILLEVGEKAGLRPIEVWITRYKGNTPQQIKTYGLEAVRESVVIMKK